MLPLPSTVHSMPSSTRIAVAAERSATDAHSTKNGNGYTVTVNLEIKKLDADSAGRETPIACNDYFEVAVYKDRNTIARTARYKLKDGAQKLEIPVSVKPYKVVIDPRFLLIDKKSDDNEKKLDVEDKVVKK